MRDLTPLPGQFGAFRILFGVFLASHFVSMAPFAAEIYGTAGMYPLEVASPFPNVLMTIDEPRHFELLMWALAALSGLFAFGVRRRVSAVLLWYGWACLVNRVPFLFVPSDGLVGWLLLLSAFVPAGEPWSVSPRSGTSWRFPPWLLTVAWIVLGIGYFSSGFDKLASESWRDGSAIRSVLVSPISRWDWLITLAGELPEWTIKLATWSVLAAELSFIFLIWRPHGRFATWCALSSMHLGIRLTLNLHTVTDPFLLTHFLLLDPAWLRRGGRLQRQPSGTWRLAGFGRALSGRGAIGASECE